MSIQDATARLVESILGHADPTIAKDLLQEQLDNHRATAPLVLARTWLALEAHPTLLQQLQDLHRHVVALYQDSNLADNLVTVLAQLATTTTATNSKAVASASEMAVDQKDDDDDDDEEEEGLILRECLFLIQGVSGTRLQLQAPASTSGTTASSLSNHPNGLSALYPVTCTLSESTLAVLQQPGNHKKLGSGAADAIRIVSEAGWLVLRLQAFCNTDNTKGNGGAIRRALNGAIRTHSHAHEAWCLAQQEKQSQQQSSSLCSLMVSLLDSSSDQSPSVLRHLTTLATVTDGLLHLSGPTLLEGLERHAHHGCRAHVQTVQGLLAAAAAPWYTMLYQWTVLGRLLHDDNDDCPTEFFVTKQSGTLSNWWQECYVLDRTKIPTCLLEEDLVEPAFCLGKGINYIRTCLEDETWSLELDKKETEDDGDEQQQDDHDEAAAQIRLGYCYTPREKDSYQRAPLLRSTLQKAAGTVHSHILETLRSKFGLESHLYALKQFLLLGQGDFFSALVEGLHRQEQQQQANGRTTVYRHTLVALVETALRTTNANDFGADIVNRLSVEIRKPNGDRNDTTKQQQQVETVWDMFVLEYTLPDPLLAIVHPKAAETYQSMFTFLFGLKKVEFLLNFTWRQAASLQHALQRSAQYHSIDTAANPLFCTAIVLLRKVAMMRQSMMHFCVNLKSYCMFEVLEGGWQDLVLQIRESTTLDQVIQSHDAYLAGIRRKSLLQSTQGAQIQELLDLASQFCRYQEDLYGKALVAADRAAVKRRQAEDRLQAGKWGFDAQHDLVEEDYVFGLSEETQVAQLDRLAERFGSKIKDLLTALDAKLHGGPAVVDGSPVRSPALDVKEDEEDEDLGSLRFLTAQLDHNDYFVGQTTTAA